MYVLGIETSCDETAVAVYHSEKGVCAHQIYSQIAIHAEYGGVVPELASRDHLRKTLPLLDAALKQANVTSAQIVGIGYTKGPGLIGALMVGACLGRSLGWAWQVPTIGVHHLEAHLMAVMLEDQRPDFPFIALLVSGGHTMLIEVTALGQYRLLGETLDDAVGEAFDKTAKLLDLPYPGGPHLAKLAVNGDPERFVFPRPMLSHPGMDFSFSGLKTFAVNCVSQHGNDIQTRCDVARAFEEAVVDILWRKSKRALIATGLKSLVIVGGVGANQRLREKLTHELKLMQATTYFPRPEFCTDNAAMVAYVGYLRLQAGQQEPLSIQVKARWPFTELSKPLF